MLPKLTIAIPTYNRLHLLKETLSILLPQQQLGVEILVCDNDSKDGTYEYLTRLYPEIRIFRQQTNIGQDGNVLSCFEQARGQYVWILSDDDFPVSNAVEHILKAIELPLTPSLIYLRAKPSDPAISTFSSIAVATSWVEKDKDAMLDDIGEWITFISSLVAKKDEINLDILRSYFGTFLTSAALSLQMIGEGKHCVISDEPLIYVRGGNDGGYDAFTVFTKSLRKLLDNGRKFGFKATSLDEVYRKSITNVLPFLIHNWPLSLKGFTNLILYAGGHKVFYTVLMMKLFRLTVKHCLNLPRTLIGKLLGLAMKGATFLWGGQLYSYFDACCNYAARASFKNRIRRLGPNAQVHHPLFLLNPRYISVGANFRAAPGLKLEAWTSYEGKTFCPLLKIGNNVCINSSIHIGAIDRVEIGNNVLMGSHILITDHAHGEAGTDLSIAPVSRLLSSKGPVIIEDDVFIGDGVRILSGVTVGRGAIIAANSVVDRNVSAYSVVGGIPAKVIRAPDLD